MTRKQSQKVADRIVALVRKATIGKDGIWTEVEVRLSDDDVRAIDTDGSMIVGCLPMGWGLSGRRGLETVTIVRRI